MQPSLACDPQEPWFEQLAAEIAPINCLSHQPTLWDLSAARAVSRMTPDELFNFCVKEEN